MYPLFKKTLYFKSKIELVSAQGVLVKLLLSRSKKRIQVSVAKVGSMTVSVYNDWDGVVEELQSIEKEHGLLISWSDPRANEMKSPEVEMAEYIYNKHVTVGGNKPSELKDVELVKKYCTRYRKEHGIEVKNISVYKHLQTML